MVAVDDDLAGIGQLGHASGELLKRDVRRALDVRDLPLAVRANVEQHVGAVPGIDSLFELGDRHVLGLLGRRLGAVVTSGLDIGPHLADRRLGTTDRARGIFRHAPLAKPHRQRIEGQQPADQRLAALQDQLDRPRSPAACRRFPGNTPSTPASAQFGTLAASGGCGKMQR